jgi:hypothetical protein
MKLRKKFETIFGQSISDEETMDVYIDKMDSLGRVDLKSIIKMIKIIATELDTLEK